MGATMGTRTDEGIAQLRSGNKAEGRATLMQALAAGEPAAPVWYGLSLAADSLDERRIYLQKALEADPLHESARRDLAGLGTVATPAVQERAPAVPAPSKPAEKKSGPPAAAVLL